MQAFRLANATSARASAAIALLCGVAVAPDSTDTRPDCSWAGDAPPLASAWQVEHSVVHAVDLNGALEEGGGGDDTLRCVAADPASKRASRPRSVGCAVDAAAHRWDTICGAHTPLWWWWWWFMVCFLDTAKRVLECNIPCVVAW